MMRFRGKIPISVHPFFWVLAALIGWFNSGSFLGILIWMLVIVISVIFHEFGHAITALFFGLHPRINLVAMGGVTTYESKKMKFYKQFLIVLNGPLFGIMLFLFATFILYLNIFQNVYILSFLKITQLVNIFWSIVNLLPVLPLDGGQLLRILLEAIFGIKGFRLSLLLGTIVAISLSIFFFIRGGFLIGALFFLFAFQSFDSWRKARFLTKEDRNLALADLLKKGEDFLKSGNKKEAEAVFQNIRKSINHGMIHNAATYLLAFIKFENQEKEKAYKLLLEIKENLSDEGKCMLHLLAYENKNYDLVKDLSSHCYQINPSYDVALINAKSFAFLKKAKEAGGWLQTLLQYENAEIEQILKEKEFQEIKENEEFKKFF